MSKNGEKNRKKKKAATVFFLSILLVVLIAPSILTRYMGIGISPILTGSMRPYANPGDLFITHVANVDSVKVGEVVVLKEQFSGTLYSHRIAKIELKNGSYSIRTKGDANNAIDVDPYSANAKDHVLRVVGRVRWLGRPLVFASSTQGKALGTSLIVVANVLALFVFLFRKPIKDFRAKRRLETVYRDLYIEERKTSEQYREIIEQFNDTPLINTPSSINEVGIEIPRDMEPSK